MSSDDNLDFELFGITNVDGLDIPSFGEFEYPDTTRYTPQTPLSLPPYVEPPLFENDPVGSSSNLASDGEVGITDENHVYSTAQTSGSNDPASVHIYTVGTLGHDSINDASRDHNAFANNAGSTRPDDTSTPLNPPTQQPVNYNAPLASQSQYRPDYRSGPHNVAQNVYTNVTQPSISFQSTQAPAVSLHYPLPYGTTGIHTKESQTTTKLPSPSSHYPLPYTTGTRSFPAAQPSTSLSRYPVPHGLNKAESLQSSTSSLQRPRPGDTAGLKATKSRKKARPSAPSLPGPSSCVSGKGYNGPIDLTEPINKGQPSASIQNPSSYDSARLGNSGHLTRRQPSTSSLYNALGTAGINTVGSVVKALPSTSASVNNPPPHNSNAGDNSTLDWNAIYATLGIGWDNFDNNAADASFTNTKDASIPSYTQSTTYDSPYATPPRDGASNQGPGSQNIGMFTNVARPATFTTQHSSVPSINANTSIPSHVQSTNYDVLYATQPQPQYGYNQGSGLQNTAQRGFTNVAQPSTSSRQTTARHYMAGSLPMIQSTVPLQHPDNLSFDGRYPMLPGPVNVPENRVNCSTTIRSNVVIPIIQQNTALMSDVDGSLYNRDAQGIHTNLNVNRSGVAYNQRSIMPPTKISTTRYNAYATVPNVEVPPTSGVPSVDMVNRQYLYPTPPPYTAYSQGGTYYPYPPFNNVPSRNLFPDACNYTRPSAIIPVPVLPASAAQPAPMQTNMHRLSRPVCMLPSPPNSANSISFPSTSSAPAISAQIKRKRDDDDDHPTRRAKKRKPLRPSGHLYEKTASREFRCLYVGPANPGGCKDAPLATIQSLSRHIRTQHAKREVEMDILPEQRIAFNGLPPGLRTVPAVCPLDEVDLMKCRYSRENGGQRWQVRTMKTADQAVRLHIESDHNP